VALVVPTSAHATTIYVLTLDERLLRYDSGNPGTVLSDTPITGIVESGVDVSAIECRPDTGQLYLLTNQVPSLGNTDALYTLDPVTGVATRVAALQPAPTGIAFGFDFDPVGGQIRLFSNREENFSVDPTNGNATAATAVSYPPGDPGFGANPCLEGAAFANSAGGGPPTLYGIDTSTNTLVTLPTPATGVMHTIGPIGADAAYDFAGFDIAADGTAFAAFALEPSLNSGLYTIDLATGAATLVGPLAGVTPQKPVVGMTVACSGPTHVTVRSVTATRRRAGVLVRWRTAAEVDTLGFHVYREGRRTRVRLTQELIAAGGFGRSAGRSYSYVDRHAKKGATRYWIEAVALDGFRSWLGPAVPR
jgi:hypothetical protein